MVVWHPEKPNIMLTASKKKQLCCISSYRQCAGEATVAFNTSMACSMDDEGTHGQQGIDGRSTAKGRGRLEA